MKKKILLLSYHQFGYLTDTYKYCEYLKNEFDITYIGWNYGKSEIVLQGIRIKHVSRQGNLYLRNSRLLKAFHTEINSEYYDKVFMHYTRGVSLIKILNKNVNFIFDIRTLSVHKNIFKRISYNWFLKLESLFFKNKTVISKGIAKQLYIRRFSLLPLGADPIVLSKSIPIDTLNLLYVGTLQGRDIIKCVKGFYEYIKSTSDSDICMTIIGDSSGGELREIKEYINEMKIIDRINCVGRVPHSALEPFFEKANIGISFIPITKWYNHQPPTKTYEYLMSGMPVIATKTFENYNLLKDEKMCVLIDDSEENFALAIKEIRAKMRFLKPEELIKRYEQFSWKNIVTQYFLPIIISEEERKSV